MTKEHVLEIRVQGFELVLALGLSGIRCMNRKLLLFSFSFGILVTHVGLFETVQNNFPLDLSMTCVE